MKKYLVMCFVNGNCSVCWEFETLEQAKDYFDERVRTISIDRKNENRQSVIKFHDTDCWGYELDSEDLDTNEYETLDSACMSWKEAKKEK